MKIAYLDCSNGISGDMFLAALLDAGLNINDLKRELAKLPVSGYSVAVKKARSGGVSTSRLVVKVNRPQYLRHLPDIRKIISRSLLAPAVKKSAKGIFARLARAEAKVHGCSINEVHFHEIGALDTIIDIIGVVWGLQQLGIKKLFCSPVNVGSGTIKIAHGIFPVPAPATAELLKDIPFYQSAVKQELATPTGAVLIAGLSSGFGLLPKMSIEEVGQSSGSRQVPGHTNLFRLLIGKQMF
ncbi:MAG: LarC family nickel insertion protein [bacterium]|nr:LarC family nickel insertion protein [bacterium]MDD5353826.1 LarC family nickel insertion protein [bacterium]MDD5756148.1 LarC family nickel insertion protein [bacterium]